MRKLDTLRTAITAALPELAKNPEKLCVWIERGTAQCRNTDTEAFGFAFQANVLIREMASDISVLFLVIYRWARVNQRDLLAPGSSGISFDADILDNGRADVQVQIQLDENVTVAIDGAGNATLEYLAEPDPLFVDGLGLGDADPVPLFTGFETDETLDPAAPPWRI